MSIFGWWSSLQWRSFEKYIVLNRPDLIMNVGLSFVHISEDKEPGIDPLIFGLDEIEDYRKMKYDVGKRNYVLGRIAAKRAASTMMSRSDLTKITISQGVFGQPVLHTGSPDKLAVSISHCQCMGAAIVFPEGSPMGIDVEAINPSRNETMASLMTAAEMESGATVISNKAFLLTLLWSSKEALSKVLRTGLTIPFELLEIETIQSYSGFYVSTFTNFPQYSAKTYLTGGYVWSIVAPRKSEWHLDPLQMQNHFLAFDCGCSK